MKCAWLGILLIGIGIEARAVGSIADVQLIDRDTGSVLPMYRYHGEYWVAGRPVRAIQSWFTVIAASAFLRSWLLMELI